MLEFWLLLAEANLTYNNFSLFISCGKNVICLAFLEKRTGETAWMVTFVDSGRLLRVRCVVV